MNHDGNNQLARHAADAQQYVEINAEPQQQGTDWPAAIHALLRGRYRWAIGLALVGMIVGASVAHHMVPLKYRSSGMIRIRANVAPVLYQTERNGMVPNFSGFVETQLGLLMDRNLVEAALHDPAWRKSHGDDPDAAGDVAGFTDRLEVSHPDGSELVVISFVDPDPEIAMVGVRALIDAYKQRYIASDTENDKQRMAVLVDLQERYDSDLQKLNKRILDIANEFGSDSLATVYDFRIKQLQKLESDLLELRLQVAALGGQTEGHAGTTAAQPAPLTSPEQIAVVDPQMRQLLNESSAARREADMLKARLGPRHPNVLAKQDEAARLDQDIEQIWNAYTTGQGLSSAAVAWRPLGQLLGRLDATKSLYEAAKHDAYDVGRKNLQIADLRRQADAISAKLQETRQRIDSLNVEAAINNRVSVVSYGDPPLRPYKDRRTAAAGLGGFGGAALGFGSVILLRLFDRRVRGLADARMTLGTETPVLGILPDLAGTRNDDSAALLAAHEIHCIRAGLQNPAIGGGHVLAVTSAGPGDGKTSLTVALGLSFANAGARTLLIDFDLVGRNLSTRMNRAVRPPIGRILRQLGLVTTEQVHDALRVATATRQLIGQVLIARGLVGHADVLHALETQNHQVVGLIDALGGVPLDDAVVGSGTDNLFLLPVGKGHARHVAQLSPKAVQRLIAAARATYDVVIVDTGPILGSLEARLVAAQADQMILAVSHGTQRTNVLQAITQLKAAGAPLAGVVFNRATPSDFLRSTSTASLRSSSVSPASSNGHGSHRDLLATAVVSTFDRRNSPPEPDVDESLQ